MELVEKPAPGVQPGKLVEEDDRPPPPIAERVWGVLTEPAGTCSRHDGSWGWAAPWLIVALAGILSGLVYMARVDITAVLNQQFERSMESMPAAQRRQI